MSTTSPAAIQRHILDPGYLMRQLRTAYLVNAALAVALMVFAGLWGWSRLHPPQPIIIGYHRDGTPFAVQRLSAPLNSQAHVLDWATRAVARAYTVDWVHYKTEFTRSSARFTHAGWASFANSFITTGDFRRIRSEGLIGTAQPAAAATIVKRGVIGDRYTWEIQFPLITTYLGHHFHRSAKRLITVYVVRAPIVRHPSGLAIAQLISAPMG